MSTMYSLELIVRVMFGNFAKIGRAARADSNLAKFPNITSTINPKLYERYRMIICLLLARQHYTPQRKTFEALCFPALLGPVVLKSD